MAEVEEAEVEECPEDPFLVTEHAYNILPQTSQRGTTGGKVPITTRVSAPHIVIGGTAPTSPPPEGNTQLGS